MVFLYEGFAYNAVFLYRILPAGGQKQLITPFAVVFNVVWLLAVWSYVQAHMADPGTIPRRWQEFVRTVGDGLPIVPARPEWQPRKATFCRKCDVPRPERAHHCVICETCVLRMDHHCPWISNCVGFRNHKFFILLGVYSCLASYIAILTALPEIVKCVGGFSRTEDGFAWHEGELEVTDVLAFLIFDFLAFFIAVLLTPMLMAHVPLAMMNITTIEDNYRNMPNPFDQGSPTNNIAQIFGVPGLDWLFPVYPRNPLSDGVSFSCFDERFGDDVSPLRLLCDQEEEMEDIWRMRYHVHMEHLGSNDLTEESALTSLSRLFACSRASN